jgi:uncharacterized membrane protein YfcA
MSSLNFGSAAAAFFSAFIAGAINSVAGGGTLVSFPVLIWLGLSSVAANATSTVAIWPGSLGGVWGYRNELRSANPQVFILVFPSIVGGVVGAVLLRWTPPDLFDRLAPFLILFATALFALQRTLQSRLKMTTLETHRSGKWIFGALLFQFFVALYGGYFGAGIGILMLAALAVLGFTDIHQMNGLKNLFALCINGVAAVYFIWMGMVDWHYVLVMAAGGILGGYLCAGFARRLGEAAVRRIVVIIGVAMSLSLLIKK